MGGLFVGGAWMSTRESEVRAIPNWDSCQGVSAGNPLPYCATIASQVRREAWNRTRPGRVFRWSCVTANTGGADQTFLLAQYGPAILNQVNLGRGRVGA